jgi:hypothetical protein
MRRVSGSGATSVWVEHYDTPPLSDLVRVDGKDLEDWLNHRLPWVGTGVDWSRVRGEHRHWFAATNDDTTAVVAEFLDAAGRSPGEVVHVGDSLSPFAVRIAAELPC